MGFSAMFEVIRKQLADQVVMITGANRGIGLAAARVFQEAGCRLALGARDQKSLAGAGFSSGERVLLSSYDAQDPESAKRWVEEVRKKYSGIGILVNNAGVYKRVSPESENEDDLDLMWAVNAKGPWRLTRAALPLLRQNGHGRIVNILSLSARRVKSEGSMGYGMSKFAAMAHHQGVRMAGWDDGVRTIAVCPGFVATDMAKEVTGSMPESASSPESIARWIVQAVTMPNDAIVSELSVNPNCEAFC